MLNRARAEDGAGFMSAGPAIAGNRAHFRSGNPDIAEHGKATRFQPGQSGNPGGVSKAEVKTLRLAKQASPEAMQALIEIMRDPNEDTRARIVAAVHILDRALGRPKPMPDDAG